MESYRIFVVLLMIIVAHLNAQYNEGQKVQLSDGQYVMTVDEVERLAPISQKFNDNLKRTRGTSQSTLTLLELSLKDFELIMQMVAYMSDQKKLISTIENKKYTIDRLYELYEYLRFLDIKVLREFIKEHIQKAISIQSPTVLKDVVIKDQEEWFKNSIEAMLTVKMQLKDNLKKIEYEQFNALKNASSVIQSRALSAKRNTVSVPELTVTQFDRILTAFSLINRPLFLKSYLANQPFDAMLDLLVNASFLKLTAITSIVEKLVAQRIRTAKSVDKKVLLDRAQKALSKDKSINAIKRIVEIENAKYNFILKDGVITKDFSDQNKIKKLIKASGTLTSYAESQGLLSHEKEVPQEEVTFDLSLIDKKTFEVIYSLVDSIDDQKALSEKCAEFVPFLLSRIANAADYLDISLMMQVAIQQLVSVFSSEDMVKKGEDVFQWVRSLGLNRNMAHTIAVALIEKFNIVQPYMLPALKGHTKSVIAVAWSPNDREIASVSSDKNLLLWNVITGINYAKIQATDDSGVSWSPDGTMIAVGANIFNAITHKKLYELNSVGFRAVAWGPDSTLLASISWDHFIQIWDIKTGTHITEFNKDRRYNFNSIAWSHDGTRLAIGSKDGVIRILNVETKTIIHEFTDHSKQINSIAWSPDDNMLATAAEDATAIVWNIANNKKITLLSEHTGAIQPVAWSSNGTKIATGAKDGTAIIWDITTRKPLYTLVGKNSYISSVAWSADSRMLALGSADKDIEMWYIITESDLTNLTIEQALLIVLAYKEYKAGRVLNITVGLKGTFDLLNNALKKLLLDVFKVRYDHALYRFRLKDGEITKSLADQNKIQKLIKASGTLTSYAESQGLLSHEKEVPQEEVTFDLSLIDKETFEAIYSLVDSIDDQKALSKKCAAYKFNLLLSVANATDNLKMLKIFQSVADQLAYKLMNEKKLVTFKNEKDMVSSLKLNATVSNAVASVIINSLSPCSLRILTGHSEYIHSISWNSDSTEILTGSFDGTLKIWKALTGEILNTFIVQYVSSAAWSPDGKMVSIGFFGGDLTIGSVKTGTNHFKKKFSETIRAVSWSPDGTMIAAASGRDAIIWDIRGNSSMTILKGHTQDILSVAWSPGGKMLATGSKDTTARLWKIETGTNIHIFEGHTETVKSVAWSPDGKMLATGSEDKTIRLWDVKKRLLIDTLKGSYPYPVSWSPNGKLFVGGKWLWDTVTFRKMDRTLDILPLIMGLTWSPNGKMLATAQLDSAQIWFFIDENDLSANKLQQALLIALAQAEHASKSQLTISGHLRDIFDSLSESLKNLLVVGFKVNI